MPNSPRVLPALSRMTTRSAVMTCGFPPAATSSTSASAPPLEYNVLEDEIAAQAGVLDHIRRAFAGETVRVPPIWYDARALRQVHVAEARRVAVAATFFPIFDRGERAGAVAWIAIVFED